MTRQQIISKLQKADNKKENRFAPVFVTKKGDIHALVKNAFQNCMFCRKSGEYRVYYFQWTGSGRHINAKDNSFYVTQVLNSLGYKHSHGNDAPRGGKEGSYLKVSKVAFETLKLI